MSTNLFQNEKSQKNDSHHYLLFAIEWTFVSLGEFVYGIGNVFKREMKTTMIYAYLHSTDCTSGAPHTQQREFIMSYQEMIFIVIANFEHSFSKRYKVHTYTIVDFAHLC